jgi:hypothetical protein
MFQAPTLTQLLTSLLRPCDMLGARHNYAPPGLFSEFGTSGGISL